MAALGENEQLGRVGGAADDRDRLFGCRTARLRLGARRAVSARAAAVGASSSLTARSGCARGRDRRACAGAALAQEVELAGLVCERERARERGVGQRDRDRDRLACSRRSRRRCRRRALRGCARPRASAPVRSRWCRWRARSRGRRVRAGRRARACTGTASVNESLPPRALASAAAGIGAPAATGAFSARPTSRLCSRAGRKRREHLFVAGKPAAGEVGGAQNPAGRQRVGGDEHLRPSASSGCRPTSSRSARAGSGARRRAAAAACRRCWRAVESACRPGLGGCGGAGARPRRRRAQATALCCCFVPTVRLVEAAVHGLTWYRRRLTRGRHRADTQLTRSRHGHCFQTTYPRQRPT